MSNDVSRRGLLRGAAALGAAAGGAGLLAACGGVKSAGGSTSAASAGGTQTLRIGYVTPSTGFAAGFGEVDPFVVEQVTKAVSKGLTIGGTIYQVRIEVKDSQSDPQQAAKVANELIASGVDMLVTSSTPETVNPVADAAEAARVPCLSTVCPWEAFYFGRGATPDKPFTYTYHFFIGVDDLAVVYKSLWLNGVPNNKKVGVLWPNDADGNAIRAGLGPILTKAGLTVVDPGAFPTGTQDFTSIISTFKKSDVEVVNSFAIPPDFATFWKQAAQQGFRPKIATIAKTGLLPEQVEALGDIGPGLTAGVYWHPSWPTRSALLGLSSADLAAAYEKSSGNQWTQNLGTTTALLETAISALVSSGSPKDRTAVANALGKTSIDTVVGRLDWTSGPVKNVVAEPLVDGKWVKAEDGPFPLDIRIVENSGYPSAPVAAADTALS
ncbi:ABC transporter substrate-binding protein [Kineosporia sp. A_224]|uniref:ABC transporter substrate-binding protein n=1 Tax=Kineosporia sp. A_224 TaxID=1962180 RepID=UPI0018E96673|nr:ABC transporter substrate-binding protein [Kineosporia sp. A_224]